MLPRHRPRRAWAAVALLAIVGTLNYADRFLPAVLAEPIKQDLELSDTMIGVINGFGFLVVYAVVGIVIARIADRGAFGLVVSVCLTLWGAMTMLGGAVQSGFQLVLTRVGVAVGEAGSTPAAHAFGTAYMAPSIAAIQRLVRVEQRATASAVFLFFGAIIGSAGPFLTGVISDALTGEMGVMSLGRALLIVPVAQIVAIGCYAAASRWFMRDVVDTPELATGN